VGEHREIPRVTEAETVNVLPLCVPSVVEPTVLATLLVLIGLYTIPTMVVTFLLNLVCPWMIFAQLPGIAHRLGKEELSAASKIAMLILATIAVRMIYRGVLQLLADEYEVMMVMA
jgi:small neutral amino acid transporter SnatA (MarC family)